MLRKALFVSPTDVAVVLLSDAFRGTVTVLLRGALFARPTYVVFVAVACCVLRSHKCFALRGIIHSFKRCGFVCCYLVCFAWT